MNPKSSFSISFLIRKDKMDSDDTNPMFMRITVNGKRVIISTGRRIVIDKWKNGKAIGNSQVSRHVNKVLDTFRVQAYEIQRDMIDHHELVTAQSIKNRFAGVNKSTKTVFEVFNYHNQQIKERIIDYSLNTYKRFLTANTHGKLYAPSLYAR